MIRTCLLKEKTKMIYEYASLKMITQQASTFKSNTLITHPHN